MYLSIHFGMVIIFKTHWGYLTCLMKPSGNNLKLLFFTYLVDLEPLSLAVVVLVLYLDQYRADSKQHFEIYWTVHANTYLISLGSFTWSSCSTLLSTSDTHIFSDGCLPLCISTTLSIIGKVFLPEFQPLSAVALPLMGAKY